MKHFRVWRAWAGMGLVGMALAGSSFGGNVTNHITVDQTWTVAVADCVFSNLTVGVVAGRDSGIAATVDGSLFADLDYGVHLVNASAAIDGCVFTNIVNEDVVLWESYVDNWWCRTAELTGNRFHGGGKAGYPVVMYAAGNFAAGGNTATGYGLTEAGVRVGGWVPKGWAATWGSNDLGYVIVAGVTVDADAASRGSLTIADGSTVYTCHAKALRVWGDLTVAGTPGGGVRFTTGGTNTPTGYGLQFDNTYGVSDLQHCRFDFMARGISIADAKTNTATVRAGGCVFSNLTERAIQIHNSPGVATLAMSNSLVTACEGSLYAYNGGQVAFAGTDFLDSGPVYGASGSQVDFEDCNFHELDVYPESGFFPKSHTSLGGPGGGFTLRHCTVAGNRGCGIRVTESGGRSWRTASCGTTNSGRSGRISAAATRRGRRASRARIRRGCWWIA
ncbi:MAG: right-handed parallel beta-helix repeat-containing protein [Lentisphaerae bacterium]|nr:right-handed parallel beta-helix repeat-containing protein [Lentisphaerota bacterium]